ncbi:BadF/BadG/BcrA/BcrD ATPase family protein [Streptomyces sp. NPDC097610]|uniref:N-acetylglucosamine kinase n=1 Tax=Streptomyces sp. NPDC097610 TaxID=3157227 RepID=UPI00332F6E0F
MTSPPPVQAWLLLEGGGSHTWAAAATGDTILVTAEGPSTNPRSVGEERAVHRLVELIDRVWDDPATAPLGVVAAHGAASTSAAAGDFATLIRRALALAGMTAPVLVTNDLTTLLLSADGPVCVANCGTGTGFAAHNGARWARSSGLEWLLSDEGGGHDLGTAGLRAVVRSLDGRGPDTALTGLARRWCDEADHAGGNLGEILFFHVYRTAAAKPLVASFAQHVLEAAEDGDTVAARLVENAAAELAAGAAAVCRATSITARTGYTLVLSGSVLTEATLLRGYFMTWAHEHLPPAALLQHTPKSRPEDLLRLRNLWLTPKALAPLAAAMPTHADPAPPASGGARS